MALKQGKIVGEQICTIGNGAMHGAVGKRNGIWGQTSLEKMIFMFLTMKTKSGNGRNTGILHPGRRKTILDLFIHQKGENGTN